MYNRDSVTHFELADNQRNDNPVSLSLSWESMTIYNDAANMEHLYQCMLAKAHSYIEKVQVTLQKYYEMCTFNNPFSVGDKVLKNNMADKSHKAKMKMKWTGPYTIVQVTAVGGYKLKDKHGCILKSYFSLRNVSWNYQGLPEADYDEDPTKQCVYQCRGNRC